MSTIEPIPPPPPDDDIMWWASPTLRALVGLVAPGVVIGVNALLDVFKKPHLTITGLDLAELVIALLSGYCALVIIRRRIAQGKDPNNPAPPIKMAILPVPKRD